MALVALFTALALGFAGIAVFSGVDGGTRGWVVAVAAAAIAFWFVSLARSALRRTRR